MAYRHSLVVMLAFGALLISAAPIFGQATFTVGSSTLTGADIGITELTGTIVLTVHSGTTAAAPLLIRYSAAITNNSASEISVIGTGALSGIASSPVLDRTANTIRVAIPAGGAVSNQISIAGVRVALAGQNYQCVTATVSAPTADGNAIQAGQDSAVVVGSIQQPFAVAFANTTINPGGGLPFSTSISMTVAESYPTAFSGSAGQYGQTVARRLRITPFPAIPPGVTLSFAATAASTQTAATFTTVSGQAETVPRGDGSTAVIYQFTGAANSDQETESFAFPVTVTIQQPMSATFFAFQAALVPIGIAVPDSQFASTDIPRYTERLVPDEADLQPGTVQLSFPFLSQKPDGSYTGIALTNPIPYRVNVSLAAYDAGGNLISGPAVTNPVKLQLPRNGQYAKLATEVFGANFNAATSGTILATAATSVLPGFYLAGGSLSGQGLDGATADVVPSASWILPVVSHQNPSPHTVLQIFNPGGKTATATLKLHDSAGSLKAVANLTVRPGGTLIQDIGTVFGSPDPNSIAGGYLTGVSDSGLVVSENFGNGYDFSVLQGQRPIPQNTFAVAHFVSGAGYSTELSFVNVDASIAEQITIAAFDDSGAPVGGNPATLSIAPGLQVIQTIDRLFPAFGDSFTIGYLRIHVEPSFKGPFSFVPQMAGSVRFTSGGGIGSAALPLFLPLTQDFVYAHVAQDLGYFTGIAILNPSAAAATINVQIFAANGNPVGSTSLQLQPGQKLAKLLFELIPASAGQLGGYVRVQSSLPVISFALFGTPDGKLLSAIPPQPAR